MVANLTRRISMHRKKASFVVSVLTVATVCFSLQLSRAADGTEYSLAINPEMPVLGQEMVVSLVGGNGQPEVGPIRWTLSGSGAPFADAGVKDRDGLEYALTPNGSGSFTVRAEFQTPQGVRIKLSLQLVVGDFTAARGVTSKDTQPQLMYPRNSEPQPQVVPPTMTQTVEPDTWGTTLSIEPAQPRVGQQVTLIYDNGEYSPPNGSAVRWNVSGGTIGALTSSGQYKSVLTFVPESRGPFVVRAEMYCPVGNLLGRITQQFVAEP